MPLIPDGLNGDLNQGAGGKYICLEIYCEENETLPGENSFPATTLYHFRSHPEPDFLPVEVCEGLSLRSIA